jgi:translation initiation factor IF-2
MAKIRVYELARELNTTNKVLVDRLKKMEIPIKSHMSSLEDEDVAKIKAELFKKPQKEVEQTRVKPTVIRRRKKISRKGKKAKPETESTESIETDQGPSEEKIGEPVEDPIPVKEEEKPEPVDVEPVDVTPAIQKTAIEKPVDEKKEKSVKAKAIDVTEEPAQIIAKVLENPETEPVQEKIEEKAEEKAPLAEVPPEKSEPKTAEKETMQTVQPEMETSESEAPEVAQMPPENEAAQEPPTETKRPEQVKPAVRKKPKEVKAAPQKEAPGKKPPLKEKTKKAAKGRKDTPAKIIRLPVTPPPRPKPAKSAKSVAAAPGRPAPAKEAKGPKEPPSPKDMRKKRKKRGDEEERGKVRKKGGFKRKEIIEGKELYAGIPRRGRKGKKGARHKQAKGLKTQITTPKAIKRRIKIDETIALSDLAKRMGIKANEMIAQLMKMGVMATVNQTIDFDTASLVAAEFGYGVEKAAFEEEVVLRVKEDEDQPGALTGRPPVVTIMGHVDHGKTSLLDLIRKTRVTDEEAGGITQHIGAYYVDTPKGKIAFLDTPGHEAFTAMRSRGAKVTDIVVLVVAADDGVMPQTLEAINHAKASDVPIIVAVNKIDKANADPDKVRRELAETGLSPEDWGGDTIFVNVSAKMKQGIEDLLEMISLQAEVMELKANADKPALGRVVEARLDSGRGPVATVLVQEGTLNVGDPVVCGMHYGKIRAMLDDRGLPIDEAGPSIPAEIVGLSGVPMAGDELIALEDEKDAKQVSLHRVQQQRAKELAKTTRANLENLYERMMADEVKELNLIIKADVHGSIEALRDSLTKLSNEEVKISVVHAATGAITESDVNLAAVSDAIIIGFNVRPGPKVQALATEENVDIRFYTVIYNVIKELKDAIVGMMKSTYEERTLGRADVRQVFHVPKVGAVAGSYVTEGKILRGCRVRVLRDSVVVYDGKLASLRRFKDDVKEVQQGYECGVGVENFNDIKVSDQLEFYYLEEIRPEIA